MGGMVRMSGIAYAPKEEPKEPEVKAVKVKHSKRSVVSNAKRVLAKALGTPS